MRPDETDGADAEYGPANVGTGAGPASGQVKALAGEVVDTETKIAILFH
jgi:hypothetical protein